MDGINEAQLSSNPFTMLNKINYVVKSTMYVYVSLPIALTLILIFFFLYENTTPRTAVVKVIHRKSLTFNLYKILQLSRFQPIA